MRKLAVILLVALLCGCHSQDAGETRKFGRFSWEHYGAFSDGGIYHLNHLIDSETGCEWVTVEIDRGGAMSPIPHTCKVDRAADSEAAK